MRNCRCLSVLDPTTELRSKWPDEDMAVVLERFRHSCRGRNRHRGGHQAKHSSRSLSSSAGEIIHSHLRATPPSALIAARYGRPYDANEPYERRPPLPVKAGKNTPIYNAHSYHTKCRRRVSSPTSSTILSG